MADEVQEIARVLKPGGRVAISVIALKEELPEAVAKSMAAYVGCIAGAVLMEDYRNGLAKAAFGHIQIVDSGADLNAYARGRTSLAAGVQLVLPRRWMATMQRAIARPRPPASTMSLPKGT